MIMIRSALNMRAMTVWATLLLAAGAAGCRTTFSEARDLAALAYLESELPQKSQPGTDAEGKPVRVWVTDYTGYEAIPLSELTTAVTAALEAVASEDNREHDAALAVLRRFAVPMDTLKPQPWDAGTAADASLYLRNYRALWRDQGRQWWADHGANVRVYRRTKASR